MTGYDKLLAEQAKDLAAAFDQEFARATDDYVHAEEFLAVRLGDDPYAIRLCDVAGLFADRRITALPSTERALLGVAGFRGKVLPVYDLAMLLGAARCGYSRWLMQAAGADVALSVSVFEGQLAVQADDIVAADQHTEKLLHIGQAVRLEGMLRPIIDIPAIVREIHNRVQNTRVTQGG